MVKKDGVVVEAVQVKNISADLTLSSLAATKTSKGGEGFLIACVAYMHKIHPSTALRLSTLINSRC